MAFRCKELNKLTASLEERGIKWHDDSSVFLGNAMERVKFAIKGRRWSAINGLGSYGGTNYRTGINEGLIELKAEGKGKDPIGWLTADDVLKEVGIL